jgi:hypothetical protein
MKATGNCLLARLTVMRGTGDSFLTRLTAEGRSPELGAGVLNGEGGF